MSRLFAVVHEAKADFTTATELADRVLLDTVTWLDADLLVHQREWVSHVLGDRRLAWKAVGKMAAERGIYAHGHFDGEPGQPDASAARKALLYLEEVLPDAKAVLLIRDQDNHPERRAGLEQARKQDRSGRVVVIGLSVVEREAWVLSGFDPEGTAETALLQHERDHLGFDPRPRSHELTACKDDTAKRSPKRVLRTLSGGDQDRERRCWVEAQLDVLRERGDANGLATYLAEVRDRLAAIVGHVP